MDFLTEVDKLVQLIECPIFTCKRAPSGREPVEPGSESGSLPLGREGARAGAQGRFWNFRNVRMGGQGSGGRLERGIRTCLCAGKNHLGPARRLSRVLSPAPRSQPLVPAEQSRHTPAADRQALSVTPGLSMQEGQLALVSVALGALPHPVPAPQSRRLGMQPACLQCGSEAGRQPC